MFGLQIRKWVLIIRKRVEIIGSMIHVLWPSSLLLLLIHFVVFWRGPKIVDPKSSSFEKGLYEENSLNQKNSHDIPPNNLKTCIFFVRKEPTTQDTIMFFVLEQNVFQSQKKDVCGVPKWRIIYYFRSLKIVRWLALHPYWGVSRLH